MKSEMVVEYSPYLVASKNSPLLQKEKPNIKDLESLAEICHGDPFIPALSAQ